MPEFTIGDILQANPAGADSAVLKAKTRQGDVLTLDGVEPRYNGAGQLFELWLVVDARPAVEPQLGQTLAERLARLETRVEKLEKAAPL